jgi:hypothetical protein
MKVLVACEESQTVCKAFREKGHEAYSCDIIECSGGHPEWHIQGDVLDVLNPTQHCTPVGDVFEGIEFKTVDGVAHTIQPKWDLIIAHPPCTYLTVTGNRWFNVEHYGEKALKRIADREEAAEFFMKIANASCDKIAIENPIGYMSTYYRKPEQIIHPYYFAERQDDVNCERKATCLWLKGLKPLEYEIKFEPRVIKYKNGKGTDSPWHINTMSLPPAERAKARSKTFPGIAKAMAEQWG